MFPCSVSETSVTPPSFWDMMMSNGGGVGCVQMKTDNSTFEDMDTLIVLITCYTSAVDPFTKMYNGPLFGSCIQKHSISQDHPMMTKVFSVADPKDCGKVTTDSKTGKKVYNPKFQVSI